MEYIVYDLCGCWACSYSIHMEDMIPSSGVLLETFGLSY